MRNFLYLDTSFELTIGLLNEGWEWKSFEKTETKKSSELVHKLVFDLLAEHELKVKDLDGMFFCAGPGSYTGMRVSEGIAQIFEQEGIDVFSFYTFEVPRLIGKDNYVWVENAFKGEIFTYTWSKLGEFKKLIPQDKVGVEKEAWDKDQVEIFTTSGQWNIGDSSTSEFIKHSGQELFKMVLAHKQRRQPYYYRDIEEEFRPSN